MIHLPLLVLAGCKVGSDPETVSEISGSYGYGHDVVELNASELRLLVTALMNFRNKVARAGKPTEDINELILMVTK